MSTLSTIAYVVPDAYVHIASDLASGTICIEVFDGRDTVRVDLGSKQITEIRDALNNWYDK